jgi:hypothetical protein
VVQQGDQQLRRDKQKEREREREGERERLINWESLKIKED